MARRAGLLRNRLNERTLLSWAQTKESLRTADSSSPVIAVMMIHDESIAKVLVICDLGYQAKADDRKGGVGTETQLISRRFTTTPRRKNSFPSFVNTTK